VLLIIDVGFCNITVRKHSIGSRAG
jgi:hypothetical protein